MMNPDKDGNKSDKEQTEIEVKKAQEFYLSLFSLVSNLWATELPPRPPEFQMIFGGSKKPLDALDSNVIEKISKKATPHLLQLFSIVQLVHSHAKLLPKPKDGVHPTSFEEWPIDRISGVDYREITHIIFTMLQEKSLLQRLAAVESGLDDKEILDGLSGIKLRGVAPWPSEVCIGLILVQAYARDSYAGLKRQCEIMNKPAEEEPKPNIPSKP